MRTTATEGLCKLLINRRINSSTLLSRIIIMYYNPTNRDDTYLCQCISSFFDQFILYVPYSQEMLEEAFFPVLNIICNAPEFSPLQEINPYEVASFILNLTRNRSKRSESISTYCVHNNLVFGILAEILNSDSKIDKDVLIKCLKDLNIEINDNLSQEDLKDGIEKVSLMVSFNYIITICKIFIRKKFIVIFLVLHNKIIKLILFICYLGE